MLKHVQNVITNTGDTVQHGLYELLQWNGFFKRKQKFSE